MIKKYIICGTEFEIPIYPDEMVKHINKTFTDEEKLELINGMKENRIKEAKKLLETLDTNHEKISIIKTLSDTIKDNLTLTERSTLLKITKSLSELPLKNYVKN